MLYPADHYLWDFWFAPPGSEPEAQYHLFDHQTPRSLPDPEMRHVRASVGHPVLPDLVRWEPLPLVSEPGEFGHLEVPQMIRIGSRNYMLFCTARAHHSTDQRARTEPNGSWTGTHYLVAALLTGAYRLLVDEGRVADDAGAYYGGWLVEDPSGQLVFLA